MIDLVHFLINFTLDLQDRPLFRVDILPEVLDEEQREDVEVLLIFEE